MSSGYYNSVRRSSGPVLRSNISPSTGFNHHYSTGFNHHYSTGHSPSLTRPGSVSVSNRVDKTQIPQTPKRTCMCSPTNHPGSYRCSLHKSGFGSNNNNRVSNNSSQKKTVSFGRLNMQQRSAMKNSIVRNVEGDLVKRALAALIRPSSHRQRRRGEFRPRTSRLSVMTSA